MIDHRILFAAGFLFYLITPVILGKMNAFQDYPGVELFQGFFRHIPEQKINAYILITFSWIPAFYLGHLAFKLIKPFKRRLQLFPSTYETRSARYIGMILFVFLALFTFVSRGALFGGGEYNVAPRGKLSTLVVVFDFFLIYQLTSTTKVSKVLVFGTIINSLILLVAGGRLTALQSFLVFLIYKTSFAPRRWKAKHIVAFMFIGFLAGSAI
ncbi:MAG: hypothetical protein H7Y03_08685, partial [Chitinophagaceae bacterium]|nr:hypothetical protein [Chitinophagaceae bacterium]